MQKTGIEYLTHVWNFYTGCKHYETGVCPVSEKCWARSMANRFGHSFEPTLHPEKLLDPLSLKKPARIGVCFTGDLFGDWVQPDEQLLITQDDNPAYAHCSLRWLVKDILTRRPQHQFFFLTKAPQNYKKWGAFPDNAYCGITVCSNGMMTKALTAQIDAKHKWLSFEPLMGSIGMSDHNTKLFRLFDWVVIGGWSGGKTPPKIEWVQEIIEACDKAGIPVFLKDNLKPFLPKERPYYTKPCADIKGKDPCLQEPCKTLNNIEKCSKAPNYLKLRQELPK